VGAEAEHPDVARVRAHGAWKIAILATFQCLPSSRACARMEPPTQGLALSRDQANELKAARAEDERFGRLQSCAGSIKPSGPSFTRLKGSREPRLSSLPRNPLAFTLKLQKPNAAKAN
jgi:hypothetical protein